MQIHCKPGRLEDKDPKLNLDLVPKSCKNTLNPVVCRIRIRKVRFSKLNLAQNTGTDKIMEMPTGFAKCSPFGKINVDLVPRPCKFTVNQLVWRIRIPKLNLGLIPKSCKYMQMNCKPAGLEDQDLKSEISKTKLASWIRGFCRHLSHFGRSGSEKWDLQN